MLPIADVAVLDLVFPSDLLVFSCRLDTVLVAVLLDVVDAEDFTADELLLEIRVDDTCGLWRLETFPEGPCTNLVGTGGEVSYEVETVVACLGDLAKRTSDVVSERGQFGSFRFGRAKCEQTLFEGDGEGDEQIAWVVLVDPSLDLGEPLVLPAYVVAFGQVDEVDDWLGGE